MVELMVRRLVVPVVIVAVAAGACGRSESPTSERRTVTIYVSTDRVFSEPVLREYERRSGVKVNPVYDTEETKSTGLANRLLAEKARPQADVFWSNEPAVGQAQRQREPVQHPAEPLRRRQERPRRSVIQTVTGQASPPAFA